MAVAVSEKSRTGFYAVILGGTICIFGGVGYILIKELLLPGGSYPVIDQAVGRLQGNTEVVRILGGGGSQLSVYGMGDGRSRRRPVIHQRLLEDGRKVIDANFYVDNGTQRGRVTLQSVEREDGTWEERYLALDIPGQPTKVLIQPVSKVAAAPFQASWNPFIRWFQ